jgi:hypothetical protein
LWKVERSKGAIAKRAPMQSRKTTATSNRATPKSKNVGHSAMQMDVGNGWSHVVKGGKLSNPPLL